jgi:hypothetical protein
VLGGKIGDVLGNGSASYATGFGIDGIPETVANRMLAEIGDDRLEP